MSNYASRHAVYSSDQSYQDHDGSYDASSTYGQYPTASYSMSYSNMPSTSSQQWPQQTSTSMAYSQSAYAPASQAYSYGSSYLPTPAYSAASPSDPNNYASGRYNMTNNPNHPGWTTTVGEHHQSGYGNSSVYYPDHRSPSVSSDGSQVSIKAEQADASNNPKSPKDKKFPCYRVTSGDTTCDKSFARKADLQRHQSCVHDKDSMERLDCTFRKCTRKGINGFLRKDHLTEHLRHFHNQKLPKRHRRGVSDVAMQGNEQDEDLMQDYGYSQQ